MPTIPITIAQRRSMSPLPTPEEFGAGIGRAVQEVGRAGQALGLTIDRKAQEQNEDFRRAIEQRDAADKRIRDAELTQKVNTRIAMAEVELEAAENEAEATTPDADAYEELVNQKRGEVLARAQEGLNEQGLGLLMPRLEITGRRSEVRSASRSRIQRIDAGRASLEIQESIALERASWAGPVERALLQSEF